MTEVKNVRFGVVHDEVWWGILAGLLSLIAVFVVPDWVGAEGDVATSTATTTTEAVATSTDPSSESDPLSATVRITVRTETGIVTQEVLALSEEGATSTLVTPTAGGDAVPVDARSALALLVALDTASDAFSITDLAYYPAYGSFFLNCIDVPEHLCGYWQYTVNGEYPAIGADKLTLTDGDEVYFFFGSPRLVSLSATSTPVNVPVVATMTQYDPAVGAYVPKGGFTLGVVQTDPANPFVPIEVVTAPTDTAGQAVFTVATSGAYQVGIQEDFYFPTVPLLVYENAATSTATSSATTTSVSAGGGGGGLLSSGSEKRAFDVRAALAYLASQQKSSGSFGAAMYTDWVALALAGSTAEQVARERVRTHLIETASGGLSSVTDYERRSMTLMALGVNPYSGTEFDFIAKIVSYFDGTQIGDDSLVNDDIFALIPLSRAGFDEKDSMIQKIVTFVLAKQKANGSWEGSVDLTAAAVQALVPLKKVDGVEVSLTKATSYLKSTQKEDGGFGDVFATSWVTQAIRALGESVSDWQQDSNDPVAYLTKSQQSDGGMVGADDNTRIWATAYAIPAALGKSWTDLMSAYRRSAVDENQSTTQGGTSSNRESAPSTATTTSTSTVASTMVVAASSTIQESTDVSTTSVALLYSTTSAPTIPSVDQAVTPRIAVAAQGNGEVDDRESLNAASSVPVDQTASVGAAENNIKTTYRMLAGVFVVLLVGYGVIIMRRRLSM